MRCPYCFLVFHRDEIEHHIETAHQPSFGQALRKLLTRRFLIYAAVIGILLLAAFFTIGYSIATISAALGVHR